MHYFVYFWQESIMVKKLLLLYFLAKIEIPLTPKFCSVKKNWNEDISLCLYDIYWSLLKGIVNLKIIQIISATHGLICNFTKT